MFNKLKRAFGFSAPDDDTLIQDDPEMNSNQTIDLSESTSAALPDTSIDIEQTTQKIFEHVVIEFNKALPAFLQNSIDSEKQQKFLFDSLDNDIKEHFKSLELQVMAKLDQQWRKERERLQSDLKQLELTAKDIDNKRADIKEKQLSAERQRRALSDRVRDLEKQIMTLEAEKEQYELETKSLVNKVKVSQVHEKELDSMREQIVSLQNELKNYKQNSSAPAPAAVPAAASVSEEPDPAIQEELKRLKGIENDYNELVESLGEFEKKMDEVQHETELKNKEIENLTKQLETLSPAIPVNEEIRGLQDKLASTKAELEEALKKAQTAEIRAQKAEAALNAKERLQRPHRETQIFDDDILNGTEWAITSPVKRPRKTTSNKKDKTDDGELSLW